MIATPRLRLRPLTVADAPALAAIGEVPEVGRMMCTLRAPFDAAAAADWIARFPRTGRPGLRLGIEREGKLIGAVSLGSDAEGPPSLSYFLAPAASGQGLASEAVQAFLDLVMPRFGLVAVLAEYFADNPASGKVLMKLGFRPTGRGTGRTPARPEPAPTILCRLDRAGMALWPGLASERLSFRPLIRADAPAFRALVTRADVGPMLFLFPPDMSLAAAEDFLATVAWTARLPFRLAIEREGVWQGWIGVSADAEPEIFYALEPYARGRGLAREAVAAFSAFLLGRFPVPALTAGVFTDNPASARVLEACGYLRTGTATHASAARPAPAPAWQYRLSRS